MRMYEYRLYPTREQERRLASCLEATRQAYNAMLDRTKQTYDDTGKFLFKYDLNAAFKGTAGDAVPATTLQCVGDRLDKALHAYLRRKEDDPRAGFPRFKAWHRWRSFQLRQHGRGKDFWLDDSRLRVPAKLGTSIKVKLHRPLVGTPKTCYLVRRADNHWYALIACETEVVVAVAAPDSRPSIGIDVGLKVFLADSEGNTIPNPRYYQTSLKALRRKQRALCRRKKGSLRRRKAAQAVAKTHLKIDRQRRDFHFKTAKRYADAYRLIAVEDLVPSRMVHGNLAKSILDAGWGAFLEILDGKAASAGGRVVRIDPRYTTQICSRCGGLVQKSLSVRTHVCPSCGYVADRDVNAARNILSRAGALPSGTLGAG